MEIIIGSKVIVRENANPKFTRGLSGVVVSRNQDLCVVELKPADYPSGKTIDRKNTQRAFYDRELILQPDRRLLDWLAR